jgi:glycosyltransferase involved in cell wall biosynthesis
MPLYNQTEFLIVVLQSLLAQTYRDFRLVVVDDSTESEPGEIVKEFALKDKRICYIKNEFRMGRGSRIGSFHEWRKGKFPWMKKLKKWIKQSKWIQSINLGFSF